MRSKNVKSAILVSLDCIRQDSLDCYGGHYGNSKTIDSLAWHGAVFSHCISTAPYTPAAHASVFTGRYPYNHGLRHIWGMKIKSDVPTLAELLKKKGIACGGFVSAAAMNSIYGLNRGFDVYSEGNWKAPEQFPSLEARRDGKEVTDDALGWLSTLPYKCPFFLFVHYFDAHAGPSTGDVSRKTQLDGLQKIDQELSRLIDTMRRERSHDDCKIIIFSDHGESFGTHGKFGHRTNLYDELMLVPLIVSDIHHKKSIKPPDRILFNIIKLFNLLQKFGSLRRRNSLYNKLTKKYYGWRSNLVSIVDIFPTLCEHFGIEMPNDIDGESLKPCDVKKRGPSPDRIVYGETSVRSDDKTPNPLELKQYMLRTSEHKLIIDTVNQTYEFYDIQNDTEELNNIYNRFDRKIAGLENKLIKIINLDESDANGFTKKEEEKIRKRLADLGYL